ncbi:MAG: hypothetical protein RDV48_03445 [Candidatus Eremiobacteraeota bacterium]|nr:hypothetical protein [Candidatus Eremiobacteraeota bacterium]
MRKIISAALLCAALFTLAAPSGDAAPKAAPVKTPVEIDSFKVATGFSPWWGDALDPATLFSRLMEGQIKKSKRFVLGSTPEGAKAGTPVYLVRGTVTKFAKSDNTNITVACALTFTDKKGGFIAGGVEAEKTIEVPAEDLKEGTALPYKTETFKESSLGKGFVALARELSVKIEKMKLKKAPHQAALEGYVLDVTKGRVTLDIGKTKGVLEGMIFTLIPREKGAASCDLKVTFVDKNESTAEKIAGSGTARTGDRVKRKL